MQADLQFWTAAKFISKVLCAVIATTWIAAALWELMRRICGICGRGEP